MPRFELTVSSDNGNRALCLSVIGEIDLATGPELRNAVVAVLDCDATEVTVDLSGVDFIDAAGLGSLIGAANAARVRGRKVTLRHPSRAVQRLLGITGLDHALVAPGAAPPGP